MMEIKLVNLVQIIDVAAQEQSCNHPYANQFEKFEFAALSSMAYLCKQIQ